MLGARSPFSPHPKPYLLIPKLAATEAPLALSLPTPPRRAEAVKHRLLAGKGKREIIPHLPLLFFFLFFHRAYETLGSSKINVKQTQNCRAIFTGGIS